VAKNKDRLRQCMTIVVGIGLSEDVEKVVDTSKSWDVDEGKKFCW